MQGGKPRLTRDEGTLNIDILQILGARCLADGNLLMSCDTVAHSLQVTTQTVRNLCETGELPCVWIREAQRKDAFRLAPRVSPECLLEWVRRQYPRP